MMKKCGKCGYKSKDADKDKKGVPETDDDTCPKCGGKMKSMGLSDMMKAGKKNG
jgi:hypothetical protein